MEKLGLQGCIVVGIPGTSAEGRTKEDASELLDSATETRYRALVARANYLSPDRVDVAYSVKELAKSMAKPTIGDFMRLKRLGRYMAGRLRQQIMYK